MLKTYQNAINQVMKSWNLIVNRKDGRNARPFDKIPAKGKI